MKLKFILILTLTIGCLSVRTGSTAEVASASIKQTLRLGPGAEMPARAAALVQAANARDREGTALEAVKAGMELNPAVAPTLVAAIAKAAPDTAPAATAAAAQREPQLAAAIARAAAAAAPGKAGGIVAAVCRVVPNDYKRIATAVAQVAPDAAKEILGAVASAIPSLKEALSSVLASYGTKTPSVVEVLDSPALARAARASFTPRFAGESQSYPRGPTIAPPYVPYSGSASGLAPSDTGPVPRGERNYATP